MVVETAEDRLSLLDEFGVEVAYSQRELAAISLLGVFDRQHLEVATENGAVSGFAVTLTCRTEDLARLASGKALQGDRLVVAKERWEVTDVQPDGTGIVILVLRRV